MMLPLTSKSTLGSHFLKLVLTKTLCDNVQEKILHHGPHVFDLAGINWIGNPDCGKVTHFKLPLRLCSLLSHHFSVLLQNSRQRKQPTNVTYVQNEWGGGAV